jgi:hypothetical protein
VIRRILLDIDALLDTRLGLLSQLNSEVATRVVQSNAYWERDYTDWERLTRGGVTNAAFEAAWVKRDIETARQSIMTGIIPVLMRVMAEYDQNMRDGVVTDDLALEVNLHPYEFNDEETEELTEILKGVFYQDLTVTFCSRPLEELTPVVLNEHYSAVVLFDFNRWIKHHCLSLGETRCKGLSFIVPRLFEKDPSQLSLERKQEEIMGFRLWFVELFEVEFIDAEWFSMYRPSLPAEA